MTGIVDNHASKYLLVVGHAAYDPWFTILTQGQEPTWMQTAERLAPSKMLNSFGKPTNLFLKSVDSWIWNLRWDRRLGRFSLGLDFILQKLLRGWVPGGRVEFDQKLNKTILRLDMPDLDHLLCRKTLAIMRYFMETEANYLVMTTTSSFLQLPLINQYLRENQSEFLVAGRIVEQSGRYFPSGAFRIFSRQVVQLILENSSQIHYWLPEDLAIGRLLEKFNIPLSRLESIDLPDEISILRTEASLLKQTFHFRLKSGTMKARNDVKLMHLLSKRLGEICQTV